jgi:putative hydrolase of the HAD superfamily
LFDLDDTLYPERQFVDGGFRAVAGFLAPRSGRTGSDLSARLWDLHVRDGRGHLFDTLLAELDLPDLPELVAACLLVYRTHLVRLTAFDGVGALLGSLRAAEVRTGIVSDGNAAVQARKIAGLQGLAGAMDVVVLTDELGVARAKPSPVAFRVACLLLEVEPSATIYVGNDPRKDFAGAREAGLRTIRAGRLPDEGGTPALPLVGYSEADVVVESIQGLSGELAELIE